MWQIFYTKKEIRQKVKRTIRIIACICGIPLQTPYAHDSTHSHYTVFDVFPLKPNVHYIYDYYFESKLYELAYLSVLTVDSGTVEYVILDSMRENDTTIVWNVEERQALWHRRLVVSNWDSIFVTYDTVTFLLKENTLGKHELTASSIVWKFPLVYPSQAIYRYANSKNVLLALSWAAPFGTIADTLWFYDTTGLYRRIQSFRGSSGIQYHSSLLKVQLRENPLVGVKDDLTGQPTMSLEQNFPNPFNPTTRIRYTISGQGFVTLKVFDVLGREVAKPVSEPKEAGEYEVEFDTNKFGLTSGVYFYQLSSGTFTSTKKFVLAK